MESKGIDPPALDKKPEIPNYILEYVEAFYHLSARRTIGYSSENPISVSDIDAFLNRHPTDDLVLFEYLMIEMDNAYLVLRSKKPVKVENTDG